MSSDVELRVPPDVLYVGLARLVVTAAARQSGLDDGRIEDLKIAVSEATTNAIRAHQRVNESRPVELVFGPDHEGFRVTIRDTGPGFEPPPEGARDRDLTEEGGLGVTLIRGLADSVTYQAGSGTRVHMTFTVGASESNGQG